MFSSVEQGKPVMQYIRELEQKIRELRAKQGRLDTKVFLVGLALGAAVGFVVGRLV